MAFTTTLFCHEWWLWWALVPLYRCITQIWQKEKRKKKSQPLQTHFDGETSYEYLPNAYFVFRTAGPGDTEGKKIYIYYPPGQKFWWKPSDNWELGEKKWKYALC